MTHGRPPQLGGGGFPGAHAPPSPPPGIQNKKVMAAAIGVIMAVLGASAVLWAGGFLDDSDDSAGGTGSGNGQLEDLCDRIELSWIVSIIGQEENEAERGDYQVDNERTCTYDMEHGLFYASAYTDPAESTAQATYDAQVAGGFTGDRPLEVIAEAPDGPWQQGVIARDTSEDGDKNLYLIVRASNLTVSLNLFPAGTDTESSQAAVDAMVPVAEQIVELAR